MNKDNGVWEVTKSGEDIVITGMKYILFSIYAQYYTHKIVIIAYLSYIVVATNKTKSSICSNIALY